MTKSTFGDLSTAAASNTVIDGQNVDENCQMNTMNNAIRALGAAGKGALSYVATSGTDTYTATLAPVPDGYATGFQYLVNFLSANTQAAPTINLNALGAITITLGDGSTSLVAGSLKGCHILEYDGSVMRVLNPVKTPSMVVSVADAANGGLSVSTSAGVATLTFAPSDLSTKTTLTTSDSLVIEDAADSNKAKTVTLANFLASNSQALGGSDTTHPVTSAALASGLNAAATGHIKLPGGLIINWGTITFINSAGPVSQSFDLAFPSAVFSVAGMPGTSLKFWLSTLNTTTIAITVDTVTSNIVKYIAIGN